MTCAQCRSLLDVSELEPFSEVVCPECGNQDRVPARLGQFLLLELIGTGGMGGIYRAQDESLGRLVAIKVISKAFAEDPNAVELLKHEAQSAAKLNHPHVAQIYAFGQIDEQPFIAMELVSGKSLDRFIENQPGGLDAAFVLGVGIEIAEGLEAAEAAGLVHGDIKPENILLDDKKDAKLVDFGIASLSDQAATEGVWGTPYYIAPEKLRRRKSDARSDIYSLAATLYHALAGIPPFEGETPMDVVKARLTEIPVPLSEIKEDIDQRLSDTIARALEREPARRHPTYASLIGDMKRCLKTIASKPRSGSSPASGKRVVIKQRRADTKDGSKEGEAGAEPTRAEALREASVRQAQAVREAAAGRRRVRRFILISILAILALVGAGIGLGFYFDKQRQVRNNQEKERIEFDAARSDFEKRADSVALSATNIFLIAAQFETREVRVRDAVRDVLDITLDAAATEGDGEGDDQVDVTANGTTGSNQTALVRDTTTPLTSGQEMKQMAMHVLDMGHSARTKAREAAPISRAMGLLHRLTLKEPSIKRLRENGTTLSDNLTLLNAIKMELETLLQEADAATTLVVTFAEEEFDRRANAQRQETEERQEKERQTNILNELSDLEALEAKGRTHIESHAFREAARLIEDTDDQFETDQGRDALNLLQERYARMLELHEFLIERLKADPFAGGWLGSGGKREDVLSADWRVVKLKGRRVAWDRVSTRQYLRFAKHYLADVSVRLRDRGRYYLAAALYCYELGGVEAGKQFTKRAIKVTPVVEADANRLLSTD